MLSELVVHPLLPPFLDGQPNKQINSIREHFYITYIEVSFKGRTQDFGPCDVGSIPAASTKLGYSAIGRASDSGSEG